MLKVILRRNEEERILNGHPWVFSNEVMSFDGEIKSGEVVGVYSSDKTFVGYGFLNTNSKIIVRMLSLDENEVIDRDFFYSRIKTALLLREKLSLGDTTRLIFAEADFLPGLIVDKYGDILSVQFLSLGMDKIKSTIVDILVELLNPRGIYERSDVPVRLKEGLEECKGILYGENFSPLVVVEENGIKMQIDIENGQKTGYFLDQKLNRDYLKYYVKDMDVLDCFSHTGGFALHAAKYQAKSVVACDISAKAVEDIRYNASLNGFSNISAVEVDVFDYLRDETNNNKFDVIVLDPPAFTKSKGTVKKAYRGYKEINLQAMKMIKKGGILLTFSCSQHMTSDLFLQMIKEASIDSKRMVQMLDYKIQSPDHPTLLSGEEQLYLKCVVLRIL